MKKQKCISEKKCSGIMVEKQIDLKLKRGKKKVTIPEVCVWECDRCGEQMFPYESAEKVEAYKEYSGRLLVRVDPLTHKRIIEKAKKDHRSLNQEISYWIEHCLTTA